MPTVRSFCRVCTSVCGILVDIDGDRVVPDVTLWDILSPRVSAQHTDALVAPVGQRRSMWWVLAEIGRRLGHALADSSATDEAMLAEVSSGGRAPYDELVANGWAEADRELPAPWVDRHIERVGGWRLAPRVLIDQLHALREPAPLVLVPRRQMRRLNAQLEFLGGPPRSSCTPTTRPRRVCRTTSGSSCAVSTES
jgi:hypothetical protein